VAALALVGVVAGCGPHASELWGGHSGGPGTPGTTTTSTSTSTTGTSTSSTSIPSGPSTIVPFSQVRTGESDAQVVIGFIGPDPATGDGCDETYGPQVNIDDGRNVVTITLNLYFPRADPACALGHGPGPRRLRQPTVHVPSRLLTAVSA
jgi:hypothetical protein